MPSATTATRRSTCASSCRRRRAPSSSRRRRRPRSRWRAASSRSTSPTSSATSLHRTRDRRREDARRTGEVADRPQDRAGDEGAGRSRNLSVVCKDGADFYFQVPGRDVVFDFKVGRFTLAPAFFDALNKEVSRRAGLDIDVTADKNALPERLRKQADEVPRPGEERPGVAPHGEARRQGGNHRHRRPERGRELVGAAPPGGGAAPRSEAAEVGPSIELTLQRRQEGHADVPRPRQEQRARPRRWRRCRPSASWPRCRASARCGSTTSGGAASTTSSYDHKRKEKERRDTETSRLVCRDWPAFCKLVIAVAAITARKSPKSWAAARKEVPGVVALLAGGKFEKLDWNDERWEKELRDVYDRGAGELHWRRGSASTCRWSSAARRKCWCRCAAASPSPTARSLRFTRRSCRRPRTRSRCCRGRR